jgi:hypothetical protein
MPEFLYRPGSQGKALMEILPLFDSRGYRIEDGCMAVNRQLLC